MKKFFLSLAILPLYLSCFAVEPWSGIGVLFFKCHYPEMTEESINLDIFDSTLTKKILSINSKSYYLNEGIEFIEFADETKGLCINSILDNAIQVILNDRGNQVRYGYVKKENKDIGYCLWSSLIPYQKAVFPISNKDGENQIVFFKTPNGEILNIQIPKMEELWYEYKNEIIKVFDCDLIPTGRVSNRTWLQVDLSFPHDEGQDDFECHRIRAWIRYLDDSGHPLVWYYTRD